MIALFSGRASKTKKEHPRLRSECPSPVQGFHSRVRKREDVSGARSVGMQGERWFDFVDDCVVVGFVFTKTMRPAWYTRGREQRQIAS
jgi:hypothetical protein